MNAASKLKVQYQKPNGKWERLKVTGFTYSATLNTATLNNEPNDYGYELMRPIATTSTVDITVTGLLPKSLSNTLATGCDFDIRWRRAGDEFWYVFTVARAGEKTNISTCPNQGIIENHIQFVVVNGLIKKVPKEKTMTRDEALNKALGEIRELANKEGCTYMRCRNVSLTEGVGEFNVNTAESTERFEFDPTHSPCPRCGGECRIYGVARKWVFCKKSDSCYSTPIPCKSEEQAWALHEELYPVLKAKNGGMS